MVGRLTCRGFFNNLKLNRSQSPRRCLRFAFIDSSDERDDPYDTMANHSTKTANEHNGKPFNPRVEIVKY